MSPGIGVGVGLPFVHLQRRGGLVDLLGEPYTFTRASARTHPVTGAEVSSGVALTRTVTELVASRVSVASGTDGYAYVGRLPDGRYVFNYSGTIVTSTNGEPPFTELVASGTVGRITAQGTFLRFNGEPAVVYRRPSPYTTETEVQTLNRGYPATNGVSGSNTGAASGMCFASHGDIVMIGEYSNTGGVKDSANPPRWIWKSEDDGETWSAVEVATAETGTHMHSIMYDATTGNWYCSIGDSPSSKIGIYKSTNDGDSWSLVGGGSTSGIQPVSAFRFGDYIVWGTDTAPSGLWIHDPSDDSLRRIAFDTEDTALGYTWSGVMYNIAQVGDHLFVMGAQGQESYHKILATSDLNAFHNVAEVDSAGWTKPLVRSGSMLVKPSESATGDCVNVANVRSVSRTVLHTDEAVDTLTSETTPMDTGTWTVSSGELVSSGGPSGLDAYKVGDLRRQNIVVSPGDIVEYTFWMSNPNDMSASTGIVCSSAFLQSDNTFISQVDRTINASRWFEGSEDEWQRWVVRVVAPALTGKVNLRFFLTGATYDSSDTYFLVSGATVSVNSPDAGMETHDRADESASWTVGVGDAWGVYDRIYPGWDTAVITDDKDLMVITDDDTSDALTIFYDASEGKIAITDGSTTASSETVRCYGPKRRIMPNTGSANRRSSWLEQDTLSFGLRVNGGTAELVVWDKKNHEVDVITAPGGSFAPSTIVIDLPASGVAHAPVLSRAHLTGTALYRAMVLGA